MEQCGTVRVDALCITGLKSDSIRQADCYSVFKERVASFSMTFCRFAFCVYQSDGGTRSQLGCRRIGIRGIYRLYRHGFRGVGTAGGIKDYRLHARLSLRCVRLISWSCWQLISGIQSCAKREILVLMKRLTLFGEFVVGLQEHLSSNKGRRLRKGALVWEITGQGDSSQASRYLHEYAADRELFWYHKSTIAKIIVSSSGGGIPDGSLVRRIGTRGHKFVGNREDPRSVKALGESIDAARGIVLDEALRVRPLDPDDSFCRKMYALYDARYGRSEEGVSDLERYVSSVDPELDALTKSREIYKRLLVAILLGPEAVPAIAFSSTTAVMRGKAAKEVVDGFSLTQLVVKDGAILPLETIGFDADAEVLIGLSQNPDAMYSPRFIGVAEPYVSYSHAIVKAKGSEGGDPLWVVVNKSESNGTAVRHLDGSMWSTRNPGETEPIRPGEEIWLAPLVAGERISPEFTRGAVIRFGQLTTSRRKAGAGAAEEPSLHAESKPSHAQTPRHREGALPGAREGKALGFVLEDYSGGSSSTAFRYAEIEDDEAYFTLSIGRQGDYGIGCFLGSAVGRRHAYIEPDDYSGNVMLTNCSANVVIVRHVGGTFDELEYWQCVTLSDGDEIYLAGGVEGSEPYRSENGAVIGFHYIRSMIALSREDNGENGDIASAASNAIPDNEEA